MTDEKGPDEKVICVSQHDPAWSHAHDIHDLRPEFRDEIEHFFQVYKELEGKKTATRGFGNRAEALEVIEAARSRAGADRSAQSLLRGCHPLPYCGWRGREAQFGSQLGEIAGRRAGVTAWRCSRHSPRCSRAPGSRPRQAPRRSSSTATTPGATSTGAAPSRTRPPEPATHATRSQAGVDAAADGDTVQVEPQLGSLRGGRSRSPSRCGSRARGRASPARSASPCRIFRRRRSSTRPTPRRPRSP